MTNYEAINQAGPKFQVGDHVRLKNKPNTTGEILLVNSFIIKGIGTNGNDPYTHQYVVKYDSTGETYVYLERHLEKVTKKEVIYYVVDHTLDKIIYTCAKNKPACVTYIYAYLVAHPDHKVKVYSTEVSMEDREEI